jgi:PAS domain S-box-containing protein
MPSDENTRNLQELEARIKALETENARLAEHTADSTLLSFVAESTSLLDSPESILSYMLEHIVRLKNVPFCAFCELLGDETVILSSCSTFREKDSPDDRIILSQKVIEALLDEPQVFSNDDIHSQGIDIKLEGDGFFPQTVLIIPFSARLIHLGILLLADREFSHDRFTRQITSLNRVLEIIISRLDNLSLIQELKHLNTALNMEVDRRVGELRETNEQLRQAMLQRLQVEDALLRQRSIIANIAETSPVGITIVDKNGHITYANNRAEGILGLTKNRITELQYDSPAWKITDYNGGPFPKKELPFAKVMETGQPVYNVRHAIEWPDGKQVLLTINAAPLYDDDFQFDGMVAVIEDITEQVAADAEFHRLQNFNASIVQNISEGIIVQEADGVMSFINPAVAKMLGYYPEEILGKHWTAIIPEDQYMIVQQADERRQQGITDRYELELKKKSGERFPVLISGSPRMDARTGEFLGSLAVFSDITDRKQAETLNRIQRDLALQLSAVVGLEAVLQLCLTAAIKHTKLDAGGIYLVNQNTGDLLLASSQGLSPEFLEMVSFFTADSPNVQQIMQGDPVYINYSELGLSADDYRNQEKLISTAALPIKYEGQIIACLNVTSRTLENIPEATKNILEAISAQIGSAVARAQAEEQLRHRADQLKLINDIGEKIAAVLDLDSVLSLTARLIQEGFGYEHVSLFLLDHTQNKLSMKTISGDFESLFPPDHSLALGEGLVGVAAVENETTLTNDVETAPDYVNHYPDIIHTRSELSVPIQIGGEVVGVIDAQSVNPNAFDENDIMVMETLADQVAVAIHNANLHEAIQQELTKRTQIETALRESEEKFRNVVESSPMGMHMYELESDDKLVFVDANPTADTILGVNNLQFIGKTIEEAFPALTQTEVPEKYRRAAATGQPWQTEQINYDENEISGAFEVYAFQTAPGRMAAMFLEITERKRAEEALRRSENTLSSIFRAAPTGIGLVSNRVLLEVNQRICEMTGRTQDELIGQNARILYPSDEDYEYVGREKYRQINEFGTGTVETRWQHKNGQVIEVLMSSTPIDPDDLTVGVTFTALDITERKLAANRIQQQMRRLAALNQIDAAITGNLGLDRTIDILLEQTVRQLNIDAAAILLYQSPTQTLEYYALHGFTHSTPPSSSVRLGQAFSGRVALERQSIQATEADQGFHTSTQHFASEGFRSYCGVPLTAKGQVKGVLEVFDRSLLTPSEGWMSFLETLAGQAAIAIDSAELVENLERSNLELRLAYNNTLEGWAKALELRDFETRGHSQRVTKLTIQLAGEVGIPDNELVHVLRGALLHDIGKMAIPDRILLKPGPLTDEEWQIMRQHPAYANEMLAPIEFLRPALDIPHYHHEKWDGSGYPHGLKGEAIPLAARVFAIIDVWDALSSDRPYRTAWDDDKIYELIRSESGKHFDPKVVEAFLRIVDQA